MVDPSRPTALATPAPVLPIVVAEGKDVSLFRDGQALENEIERWFASELEYRAWDGEGRRLVLTVEGVVPERRSRRHIDSAAHSGGVGARVTEAEPTHAEELAEVLREDLLTLGVDEKAVDAADLRELLALTVTHGNTY